jgi:hypothetical protein
MAERCGSTPPLSLFLSLEPLEIWREMRYADPAEANWI